MSKNSDGRKRHVICILCRAMTLAEDAITTTVKGQLETGKKFEFLVTVCWFCTLDVKQSLPVCLSSSSNLNRITQADINLALSVDGFKSP